jgi:multiple sugar transport system permease protein
MNQAQTISVTTYPTKARKGLRYFFRQHLTGILMILPFLVLFAVFVVVPVGRSLYLSFTEYNAIGAPKWVGLENFTALFQDARFYKALFNTLRFVLLAVFINTALGMALAMVFGGQSLTDQIFRSLFFLPMVAGGVSVIALWKWMLSSESFGLLNAILIGTGILDKPISWLGQPKYAITVLVIVAVWNGMGYTMILFVAGLRNIEGELYEAAAIDGANTAQRFFGITLPLLRPTLVYVFITGMIGAFQIFTEPYVFFGPGAGVGSYGGILDSGNTLVLYLYEMGFSKFQLGYASAIAWILFIIIFILTLFNLAAERFNRN